MLFESYSDFAMQIEEFDLLIKDHVTLLEEKDQEMQTLRDQGIETKKTLLAHS